MTNTPKGGSGIKKVLETLNDVALQRTKEKYGLPAEWNHMECLV